MPQHRNKVMAYITSGDRLLLLEHPDHPAAGLQVPAGTLRAGEDPIAGALRQAEEETGLRDLSVVRIIGTAVFDARPFGRNEMHHRTFAHLRCTTETPECWEHWETDPSDAPGTRIRFRLFWQRWGSIPALVAGHDRFVGALGLVPSGDEFPDAGDSGALK